jgi:hypothetical protein
MRRIIGLAIAVLVGVGMLVGIVRSGRSDSAAKSGGGTSRVAVDTATGHRDAEAAPSAKAAQGGADGGGSTASIGAPANGIELGSPAVPAVPTRVVKHARVDLRIRGGVVGARVQAARDAAEAVGGYVEQTEQSAGRASITLRVPAVRYAEVLDRIEHLGRIAGRTERGDDVTAAFTDLQARIRNLRAQEAVLQDLMGQARTVADTIAVQQQLSGVTGQIEQLMGQQQLLEGQSSFATIAVDFQLRGAAPAPGGDRSPLAQAGSDALDVMVAVAGGIVIVLGALVPFVLLAVLGLAVWSAVRRRRPCLDAADV